ncbi:MAG: hypothetical protein DRG78_20835 [Epsilonproteobacteria bacterium]|nr:MAG: hypothetical protein DRG78_20835 [Campylobacterota bacterium]
MLSLEAKTTDRMIIKYKESKTLSSNAITSLTYRMKQTTASPIAIKTIKTNLSHANIIKISIAGKKPNLSQMKSLAKELTARSDVEYAEPDYIMKPLRVPDDSDYLLQHWHYRDSSGGANLEGAWDITVGSDSDVIAVIDTGVLPHTELISKTLSGYDFITDIEMANDDDGRDNNATDSGDWCYDGDACYDNADDFTHSSWHGTHVAGTIAAQSNNNEGMTGINWNAKILPIRVLGKGGGYVSDIADAMLWAAGIHVDGVADNQNPAKVLNLSLGGDGSCSQTYMDAIKQINATGAIIVIASGNSNTNASNSNPGNCPNIITVGAVSEDGSRANYSNYGTTIDISAPGGDENKDTLIYSTLDSGKTTPNYDNSYMHYEGTSMATPHIAGIASLIASSDILPYATYAQVNYILQETARSFPTGTDNDCNTNICGAGIVDATAALEYASSHKLAKYSDKVYQEKDKYIYTFETQEDKVDSASSWFINQEMLTSNLIDDEQNTSYEIKLNNIDLYDISFRWGVDSEESFDYLIFTASGKTIFAKSGEEVGTYEASQVLVADSGLDLDWTYMKDGALKEGEDFAWIDDVKIATYTKESSFSFSKNDIGKIIIITNSGFEPLSIQNPSLSDATNFTLENECIEALNFQESCILRVKYIGSFNEKHTTQLDYTTNDTQAHYVEKFFNNGVFNYNVSIINYLLF